MTDAKDKDVDRLVEELGSDDVVKRQQARAALVQAGSTAVPALLAVLGAKQQHVRWESAKSLVDIADPAAADRLVAALADEDGDVRWVVGEALIALRQAAVKPLLQGLTSASLSKHIHEGAHHVLHDLARIDGLTNLLEPVLKAFATPEPEVAIPPAAEKALESCDD